MSKPRDFAIITKATDSLRTIDRAKTASDLESVYPPAEYDIVDMTGKAEVPLKPDTLLTDYNIVAGEWNCKLSDAEILARKQGGRKDSIRRELVQLKVLEDKAGNLGPDYAGIEAEYVAQIAALEAELAGLP